MWVAGPIPDRRGGGGIEQKRASGWYAGYMHACMPPPFSPCSRLHWLSVYLSTCMLHACYCRCASIVPLPWLPFLLSSRAKPPPDPLQAKTEKYTVLNDANTQNNNSPEEPRSSIGYSGAFGNLAELRIQAEQLFRLGGYVCRKKDCHSPERRTLFPLSEIVTRASNGTSALYISTRPGRSTRLGA